MKKQKFEHKRMAIDINYEEKILGKMEREGWELVSVRNATNSVVMYWKRPHQLKVYPSKDFVPNHD